MEVKPYDKIYSDMKNYIIAHQDKLTDFNEGGVLVSQVEAISREIKELYVKCRVGFSAYLRALPYSVFGFPMNQGAKASADVVFSRSKPFSYDTTIPAGTIVTSGGLKFLTVGAGTILSGATDSGPVPVSAEKIGDKYNVGAATIKTIVSVLSSDVVNVNNSAAATGGENAEDWAAYADRFADYIIGLQRTNSAGLISGLAGLVRSIGIEEHFPPADGLWNVTLYLEDGSGGMTTEDIAKAKKIVDGNIARGIGGFRAPGLNVRYRVPEKIPVTVSVIVYVERNIDNETDRSVIENEVNDELRKYINGRKINEQVQKDNLTVLLKRLSNLTEVKITRLDGVVQANQIARFHEANITVVSQ